MLDAGGDGDLELLSVRDVSKLGWDEKEGQWRTFEESVTSDEADGAYTTCATDFVGDADLDVIGDILTRDGAPTSCATTSRWLYWYRSSSSSATRRRAATATERVRSGTLAAGRAHTGRPRRVARLERPPPSRRSFPPPRRRAPLTEAGLWPRVRLTQRPRGSRTRVRRATDDIVN